MNKLQCHDINHFSIAKLWVSPEKRFISLLFIIVFYENNKIDLFSLIETILKYHKKFMKKG